MRTHFTRLAVAGTVLLTALGMAAGGRAGAIGSVTESRSPVDVVGPPAYAYERPSQPHYRHVVVVIFENKPRGQVMRRAPYFRWLAAHGANMTESRAVTHPSQPNYLALFSGRLHGVHNDSCPHRFKGPSIASQLIAHGDTFRAYSEGLPHAGSSICESPDGLYMRKHAPWTNFASVPRRYSLPFSRFPDHYARLPTVAFVVPNMCHDTHNCSMATGDRWLHHQLSDYVHWSRSHHSLLVVTFDEDDHTAANHIYTVLSGAGVPSRRYAQPITHYSVLRTLEDLFGLPPLGHARQAHHINALWR